MINPGLVRELGYIASKLRSLAGFIDRIERALTKTAERDSMNAVRSDEQRTEATSRREIEDGPQAYLPF